MQDTGITVDNTKLRIYTATPLDQSVTRLAGIVTVVFMLQTVSGNWEL